MVVCRTLNIQMGDDCDNQRTNIFHSRCFIKGNLCSLIIDSGSCSNVVSSYLVDSLKLPCTEHPKPYHLQWLNECSEVKVTKQSLITFKLGNYEDEVWCDVVPMHATHLLLGRPWQFDRDVTHQGKLNRYSLVFKGRKFTLAPLNPSDVYKDQLKMMKFCEGVREKGQIKKTERKEASSEKSQNLNGPKVSGSASGKNRVKNFNCNKKRCAERPIQ